MSIVEKIKHIQELWTVALPHLRAPEPRDIRFWMDIDPATVEAAIMQASSRFAPDRIAATFDATQVYRWVTSTAKGMIRRTRESSLTSAAVHAVDSDEAHWNK
jgi:hypothetical protein